MTIKQKSMLVLSISCALVATGCVISTSDTDPAPQTQTITGKAADGYLADARVCLDMNHNLKCDAGEPTTFTDSTGTYRFSDIPVSTNLNNFRLVVEAIAGRTTDLDSPQAPITNPNIS